MFLFAYASFNLLMLLKLLFENTAITIPDCNACSNLCKKDKRDSDNRLTREVEEEDDLII